MYPFVFIKLKYLKLVKMLAIKTKVATCETLYTISDRKIIICAVFVLFAGECKYRCDGIIFRHGSLSSQTGWILHQRDSQHVGDRGSRSTSGS